MRGIVTLVVLLLAASALAGERTYERDFDVEPGAELSLDCHKGTIQIRVHDKPAISVEARIYPDEGTSPDLVDLVEIRERSGDDKVSIEVEYGQPEKKPSGLVGKQTILPIVDFTIQIPSDAALDLSSHKARFDVEVGTGAIEIESHKGHGTIRGVRNDLELETHKGEFEIEVLGLADLELETHKGEIDVTIHGAKDFSIDGDSHDGALRFEGRSIEIDRHHGHLAVDHREGSGSHDIDLSTHEGTITLRFE